MGGGRENDEELSLTFSSTPWTWSQPCPASSNQAHPTARALNPSAPTTLPSVNAEVSSLDSKMRSLEKSAGLVYMPFRAVPRPPIC